MFPPHRSGSVRSAKQPVTKTCSQCGAVLPSGVRACNFCDSSFSVGPSVWEESSDISTRVDLASNANIGVDGADQFNRPPAVLHDPGQKDAGWRGELSQRLETYRTRRRKFVPNEAQSQFSFDDHSRKTRPY